MKIAWALYLAITFDLEPVFASNTMEYGNEVLDTWFGPSNNSLLAPQDPQGFSFATRKHMRLHTNLQRLDKKLLHSRIFLWLQREASRTDVVYVANAKHLHGIEHWGKPVVPALLYTDVCCSIRQALLQMFWKNVRKRGQCGAFLKQGLRSTRDIWETMDEAKMQQTAPQDSWDIAVHIPKKMVMNGQDGYSSSTYFSAAIRSVMSAIAAVNVGAEVNILVFIEGREPKDVSHPLRRKLVEINIPQDFCERIGINCIQVRGQYRAGNITN